MNEKIYERVNWEARKTPLSAANLNHMDEGIENNSKAIQELQYAVFNDDDTIAFVVEQVVNTKFELPNVPVEGAYYYITSTNSIYQGVNNRYRLVNSTIKQINGGGA